MGLIEATWFFRTLSGKSTCCNAVDYVWTLSWTRALFEPCCSSVGTLMAHLNTAMLYVLKAHWCARYGSQLTWYFVSLDAANVPLPLAVGYWAWCTVMLPCLSCARAHRNATNPKLFCLLPGFTGITVRQGARPGPCHLRNDHQPRWLLDLPQKNCGEGSPLSSFAFRGPGAAWAPER